MIIVNMLFLIEVKVTDTLISKKIWYIWKTLS